MSHSFARLFLSLCLVISTMTISHQASAQTITLGGDDRQVIQILRGAGYRNAVIKSRGLTIVRAEACKGSDKYLVKVSILGKITSSNKIGKCPRTDQARYSRADARQFLEREGYDRVDAQRRGNSIVATACRNNRQYQFEFNRRGKVTDRKRSGSCGPDALTARQITRILERNGYRRIEVIDDQPPRYAAEACRNNDRVTIELNRRGGIRSENRIGRCRQQINPANLAQLLEDNGYSRIEIIDRRRPPYIAHGCKAGDKIEITIGRFGRLRNETRIDTCARPIDPANLGRLMRKEGYDQVKVLRGSRTPYLVEACKGRNLVELLVDRYGRISKQENVGTCAPPVTKQMLEDRFVKDGYLNVDVRQSNNGWTANVCRDDVKTTIRINSIGKIVSQRDSGNCVSSTVLELLKTLERRGAESTTMFVEGCYRNTKYRWAYDRLGNRTGRRAIGGC
ncbi:MAG: hypothetical protein GKR97_09585 [Rhizobiaceae bacterium]|nr:hypothetical protein [Rhizobiaceae bacterium]